MEGHSAIFEPKCSLEETANEVGKVFHHHQIYLKQLNKGLITRLEGKLTFLTVMVSYMKMIVCFFIICSLRMLTCTIGNSLIGVDALVQFLSVEEILEELLDLRDTGGAAYQNNIMDLVLVELSIT